MLPEELNLCHTHDYSLIRFHKRGITGSKNEMNLKWQTSSTMACDQRDVWEMSGFTGVSSPNAI